MGLLRRFQPILLRSTLITIYKAGQLDYADVSFDQAYNFSFPEKLESLHYNACREFNKRDFI